MTLFPTDPDLEHAVRAALVQPWETVVADDGYLSARMRDNTALLARWDALPPLVEVGVDYCVAHDGIRDVDEEGCDFACHDAEPCDLRPLFYVGVTL